MKKLLVAVALIASGWVNAQNNACFTIEPNPLAAEPGYNIFTKHIDVFGITILGTKDITDGKLKHAAAVMAEYLDNDEDGKVDNQLVLDTMLAHKATFTMFATENSAEEAAFHENNQDPTRLFQNLFAPETRPQGATGPGEPDATLEEVLHLITHTGFSKAYPAIFGEQPGSAVANAMDIARGGQFTTIPTPYPANAWYTYNDETCDYQCMVTEYIYWGLTSILGAQSFTGRCDEIAPEWKQCDKAKMQANEPQFYALLTDPKYKLAAKLPDGNYCPTPTSINEVKESSVKVFPNPSNGSITITENTNNLELVNSLGKVINSFSENQTIINIEGLTLGIYFIRNIDNNTSTKIIVN